MSDDRFFLDPSYAKNDVRPQSLLTGMNKFLASLEITFRRDPTNYRPRVNKLNSVKDKEQKGQNPSFQPLGKVSDPFYCSFWKLLFLGRVDETICILSLALHIYPQDVACSCDIYSQF